MRAWPLVVALAACGSSGPMQTTDGPAMTGSDAGPDANIPPGWTPLITSNWQLTPAGTTTGGDEIYWCKRMKVQQDVWISGFRALAPAGTHHAILTIDPTSTQVGEWGCDGTVGFNPNDRLVYASGLGTNDLQFPTGIAVHLVAGQYITLNLHLLNATDNYLMDSSGVLVQTVDPSQVTHEIDATFAGTRSIDIPADGTDHYIVGGCTAQQDWHVFALWPHMHQYGVHAKFLVNGATTMLDQPFDFTAEKTYTMNETVIHANDTITARCDWTVPTLTCNGNPSDSACGAVGTCEADHFCHVPFGESANGEMCYIAMYKYPAGDVPAYGCHY